MHPAGYRIIVSDEISILSDIICILPDMSYWFWLFYLTFLIDSNYSIQWNTQKYPAASRIIVSDEISILSDI